ncbi:MAG: hypothetical protein K2O61_06575, partial [Bacteroidaceae bacterium]|nr:hypothetical protein [Bacteroidaceae bacterium]
FTTMDVQEQMFPDMSVVLSVSEPITVLDENSTELPVAEENAKVRVRRSINANEWSTIVLPFDMTEEQVKEAFGEDVQLADFAGYETVEEEDEVTGIQVNFNAATSISANTPCLIKVAAPVSEFTVEGVDIVPKEELVVAAVKRTKKQWSEMVGTYVANTKLGEEELEDHFLFLNGNKFWYSTGATRMKGYRAYFDFYDVLSSVENAEAKVRLAINGDGTTTGMESVEFGAHNENGSWYSLDGLRLTGKPTEKGIYIVDGKKVAIN